MAKAPAVWRHIFNPKVIRRRLSSNIRFLRLEAGMTQADLAEELGVTRNAVAMWETCGACPTIEMLPVLAVVFNTSVDDLLTEDL